MLTVGVRYVSPPTETQKNVQNAKGDYMKKKEFSKTQKCPNCHHPAVKGKTFCSNQCRLDYAREHSVISFKTRRIFFV